MCPRLQATENQIWWTILSFVIIILVHRIYFNPSFWMYFNDSFAAVYFAYID